jgi:hypothetical protein
MGLFSKNVDSSKEELNDLKASLRVSFFDVKQHVNNVFQWIFYINNRQKEYDSRLEKLELHVSKLPSEDLIEQKLKEQIRDIIDEHYSTKEVLDRLELVDKRIHYLYYHNKSNNEGLVEIKQRIDDLEKRKEVIKSSLQEKMLKTITKNSKSYIKSTVLNIIAKYGRISAFRLKEMVVEEQGLCSKSSFYRILEDIESDGDFSIVWEGKEKVFCSKYIDEKAMIK